MIFRPASWLPSLPEVPDTVPLCQFMSDERYGRQAIGTSLDPYTCGLSGRSLSAQQQIDDVESLARALSNDLQWGVNRGSEYDKVGVIFTMNTIDVMTVNWAIHRLNGIASPASTAFSAQELSRQITDCGARCIFTVLPLLAVAMKAAKECDIPFHKIFICEMAGDSGKYPIWCKTVGGLLEEGRSLPPLEPIEWSAGQGVRQTAYLLFSSGTSGRPKGVKITHSNAIANVLQICAFDQPRRVEYGKNFRDVALGFLPQQHIYGLMVICYASTYRGDQVIILPRFDLKNLAKAVQSYHISTLYLVPPTLIRLLQEKSLLKEYDFSSVRDIHYGAAPLGPGTAEVASQTFPDRSIRQGFGMTESTGLIFSTPASDIWRGSAGILLPGFEAKITTPDGKEIEEYDVSGELLLRSPSVVPGYLSNETATQEMFCQTSDGVFMRTGDEVMIRKSLGGNEHVWVVDRLKEMIKVKSNQVAPAEIEECLLQHPSVSDCAVIGVPDDLAGEVPKAFIVKASGTSQRADAELKAQIMKHVEASKASYKRVAEIDFVKAIPKSASGKILRRILRDEERARRREAGSKL